MSEINSNLIFNITKMKKIFWEINLTWKKLIILLYLLNNEYETMEKEVSSCEFELNLILNKDPNYVEPEKQNDEEAGKVFIGDEAEILTNNNWQDIEKNQ